MWLQKSFTKRMSQNPNDALKYLATFITFIALANLIIEHNQSKVEWTLYICSVHKTVHTMLLKKQCFFFKGCEFELILVV